MPMEFWISGLSLLGTLIGSGAGVLISNKMVNYRIDQLEKRLDGYSTVNERLAVLDRDIKTSFRYHDETRDRVRKLEEER